MTNIEEQSGYSGRKKPFGKWTNLFHQNKAVFIWRERKTKSDSWGTLLKEAKQPPERERMQTVLLFNT